ncbi:hypothetical protein [Streptomyces sp. TRM68367]|uniref:hypothetical protein n=1 Tax=Streptomyces sp. TRM68367 TaxID=2758415 RepID=UPI0037DD8EC6
MQHLRRTHAHDAKPQVSTPNTPSAFGKLQEADLRETKAGKIVVKPGCDMKSPHELRSDPVEAEALKVRLDDLHRAKIRLADEVLVVNVRLSSPSPRSPRAVPPFLRSASTALCHPQG